MFFAFGFVLLPTMALTSPMLDELLNYPADTTGYMAIPRSIALILTGRRDQDASSENLTLGTRRQQPLWVEICRSFSDRDGLSSAKSGLPARRGDSRPSGRREEINAA